MAEVKISHKDRIMKLYVYRIAYLLKIWYKVSDNSSHNEKVAMDVQIPTIYWIDDHPSIWVL